MKILRCLKKFILTFSIIVFVIFISLSVKFYPEIKEMKNNAEKVIDTVDNQTFVRLEPTIIKRKDGEVIEEIKQDDYEHLSFEEIPQEVKEAFISIEDKRFYEHKGVDLKANLRALVALIKNRGEITQGGSTITQQLVKNTFLTNEKTYKRKINEIFMALELEKKIKKESILEYYINNIYYGNRAYGIETASNYYFNKNVKELNLSEKAFLVAIPNNPTLFDPINNFENTIRRRNKILRNMYEDKKITKEKLEESLDYNITLNLEENASTTLNQSYEVSFILSSATKIVMEEEGFNIRFDFDSNEEREHYTEKFEETFNSTYEKIRSGGYVIESTINSKMQEELQESINNGLNHFKDKREDGLYETQGAGVTIDNKSNEIVAIVGGRTQEEINNSYNRAFLSYRQPGSAIKPIVVYGIEIDNGMLASDFVYDINTEENPKNYNDYYKGKTTVKDAIINSINTVPFDLMKERGVEISHRYMEQLEFSKIVEEDKTPSISIGGFTYGVTPLEMTSAYSTLARGGVYTRQTGVNSISFNGETIYKNKKEEKRIFDEGTAYLLTRILEDVLTKGTGKGLSIANIPSAGKTGTTNDSKDGWFAGYTPFYTTSIWVGNDLPKKINGLSGSSYPGRIWNNYMNNIHEGLPYEDFKIPDVSEVKYYNPETKDISDIKKEGYIKEIIPNEKNITLSSNQVYKNAEKETNEDIKEIIRKEGFKEKYGITEEEELRNKENVINKMNKIKEIEINNIEDYDYVHTLIDEVSTLIEKNKVEENKFFLLKEKEIIIDKVEKRKKEVEERIEQEIEKEENNIIEEDIEDIENTHTEENNDVKESKEEIEDSGKEENKEELEEPKETNGQNSE